MGWNWLEERRQRKHDKKVMKWIEAVLRGEQELVWHIPEDVEWVISKQCWAVKPMSLGILTLEPGERALFLRGRGGMREYGSIVSVIERGLYRIAFDSDSLGAS